MISYGLTTSSPYWAIWTRQRTVSAAVSWTRARMQALGDTPPDPSAAHSQAWQEAKKEYDQLASEVGTAKLRHFEQTQREKLLNTLKQAPELLHKAPQNVHSASETSLG